MNPKFVILFVSHKLVVASSKVHTLCLKLVLSKLVMEQQALHIPHLYPCKHVKLQVKKQVPQIQPKKRMNFSIQNEFPLLEFQPKNCNKTFKQNNPKLVTQHFSSVDGMTFPPLVSYMYWCLLAQVLSRPKYNENWFCAHHLLPPVKNPPKLHLQMGWDFSHT